MIDDADRSFLKRCMELAREALEAGDDPFGSMLVSADGHVLAEARNLTVTERDPTRHPELTLARWAAVNLAPDERRQTTVYTSGEHCPMCAAAHGWAGLGRIVYASSTAQLRRWLEELGVRSSPVRALSIQDVLIAPDVDGPAPGLDEQVRELHVRHHQA